MANRRRIGAVGRRAGSYARRSASWLRGGGIVSNAGMALGGLAGGASAITAILDGEADMQTRMRQAAYEFTGAKVSSDGKLTGMDIWHPIGNYAMITGGAVLGKALGRVAEKGLAMIGVNVDAMLGRRA